MSRGLATAEWAWLGRADFARTAALQEHLRDAVVAGTRPETVLFCEHDPVITLGSSAQPAHVLASAEVLASRGVAVHRASRGGDVTYHGPGQLVGYPVLRLRRGVVAHVQGMAAAVIDVLADLGIEAAWRRDRPGVWVGGEKICAFGVHARHGVSIHGFALNVSTELTAFEAIVPCGLRATGVTSIAKLRPSAVPALRDLAAAVARSCERIFALSLREIPTSQLGVSTVLDCQSENEIARMKPA